MRGDVLVAEGALGEAAEQMARRCLESWDYDVVCLDEVSGGHALVAVGEAILEKHGLFASCSLDRPTTRRFLAVLEAGYGANAYHNSQHGADVALGVHAFLSHFGLLRRLSKLELLAAIIGALVHDFNHPVRRHASRARAARLPAAVECVCGLTCARRSRRRLRHRARTTRTRCDSTRAARARTPRAACSRGTTSTRPSR